MGSIHVHEFISLDGVIDTPTWTFDYGFVPELGSAIGAVTSRCRGILGVRPNQDQHDYRNDADRNRRSAGPV